MLNVNLNNEGTPRSDLPFLNEGNCNNYNHVTTSPYGSPEHLYNINQEPPMYLAYEDLLRSPLYKPQYEQFVAPQMVTKGTMTNLGDMKHLKTPQKLPTPSPHFLTKSMMNLGESKSPKRPPTPSYPKGKETCEDRACPSWAEGTDFLQISESGQGMSHERSVSLDSFHLPSFPGLVGPQSPGSRPPRNATSSIQPVWVTVIDNGHGTRKL